MAIDRYGDYCFPIELKADVDKLRWSVDTLLNRLSISNEYFLKELETMPATTMNLSHLPSITGENRWKILRGDHPSIIKHNVHEHNFKKFLDELDGLYLKEVIDTIFSMHMEKWGTPFQGRCQLLWQRPGHCYKMHTDYHTAHRYHIPIDSDPDCLFIFKKDSDHTILNMEANGNIWYLNPRDVMHTVVHVGGKVRLHVLLTSGQ